MAEWLRRWTANPMCSARVGSNPILVDTFGFRSSYLLFTGKKKILPPPGIEPGPAG